MSLSLPTHLIDTVGSAANSTRDAAGELLHDAVSAVRGRRNRPKMTSRSIAAAVVLLAVGVWIIVRRPFGATRSGESDMLIKSADDTTATSDHTYNGHTANGHTTTNGRNETMTSHTDDLKGRAKEAAGALTDNDDLQAEGKRDQQAAKAKQAVDSAVDKAGNAVKDGIDSVKEKLANH